MSRHRQESGTETLVGCVIALVIIVGFEFLFAWSFQFLWNWLMSLIFHLPTLTYWESLGCVILLGLITNSSNLWVKSHIAGFFKSSSSSE
jgi:hypothetical protein